MLGLSRGIVEVVPYNPGWPEAFQVEKRQLWSLLGDRCLDIQHIGSTAIPGMVAKPVLDIGVAVIELNVICICIEEMDGLGYIYFGDQKERGDFFFAKVSAEKETCFVHMVQALDPAWQSYLRFRDYLIENSYDHDRYIKLKIQIAARFIHHRRAYKEAKAEFIHEILRKTQDSQ